MKHDKLLQRLMNKPSDFTFDELETMLSAFGYVVDNRGKTSGSAVTFYRESDGDMIQLHKPHNPKTLRTYQINQIIKHLYDKGVIR